MKFTKKDILEAIKPHISHRAILNAVFLEINKALVRKDTVIINSFGRFYVVKSKVVFGQNFQTKQRTKLKPQYRIKFKASNLITKIVNERNLI
jgi:nucleoid DNA-binding protein